MANIKAKKKNIRKISKQTERNRKVKSTLKTLFKKVLSAENKEEKKELATMYVSALDKASKGLIIHPNKAIRHKKQVSKFIFAEAA